MFESHQTVKKILKNKGIDLVLVDMASPEKLTLLSNLATQYSHHAAAEDFGVLLKSMRDQYHEGLFGVAKGSTRKLLIFGSAHKYIALVGYDSSKQRNKLQNHMISHMTLADILIETDPKLKNDLSISRSPFTNKVMFRLFKTLFGLYAYGVQGGVGIIRQMAHQSCKDVFEKRLNKDPSQDMLPLYADRLLKCMKETGDIPLKNKRAADYLVEQILRVIGDTDSKHVMQWRSFCERAQDMAWRGYSPREILTAAIGGSESPYLQAIGKRLQRNLNIEIPKAPIVDMDFNAFASEYDNEARHQRKMKRSLIDALNKSLELKKSDPFYEQANAQNEMLLEGTFVGWCAKALQSAASLFDKSLYDEEVDDKEITQKVKDKFLEDIKGQAFGWNQLKNFSDKVIDQIKEGMSVTHSMAARIANDNSYAGISDSMNLSLSSKELQRKLDNVSALNKAPERVKKAALEAEQKAAPKTPAAAPSAPGLGGGRSSSVRGNANRGSPSPSESDGDGEDKAEKQAD